MAKTRGLPGFREARKILFGKKTTPEQMLETGRLFARAERLDQALEYFARCEAHDDIEQVVALAVERGDTALLLRARKVLGEKPTEQELEDVARAALGSDRKSLAYVAETKAGRQEAADRLAQEIAQEAAAQRGDEEQQQQAEAEQAEGDDQADQAG